MFRSTKKKKTIVFINANVLLQIERYFSGESFRPFRKLIRIYIIRNCESFSCACREYVSKAEKWGNKKISLKSSSSSTASVHW